MGAPTDWDILVGLCRVGLMGCDFKLCNNKAIFSLRSHTKRYLSTTPKDSPAVETADAGGQNPK